MKKPPLVEVSWRDAGHRHDSVPLSKAGEGAELFARLTVGFLVHSDAEKTILAMTFDPPDGADTEPEVDDRCTIPSGWITRLRYVERGPKKERKKDAPPPAATE